jgi:hypothetical protein
MNDLMYEWNHCLFAIQERLIILVFYEDEIIQEQLDRRSVVTMIKVKI